LIYRILSLISCFAIITSCGDNRFFSSESEGSIIYDVSFPYEQNSLMLELYPKEMLFEFNNDFLRGSLKSTWGVITTDLLINKDQKTYEQFFKSFGDKYSLALKSDNMKDLFSLTPEAKITPTDDTLTIAGYLCHKSLAVFPGDTLPPIELYFTKELDITRDNWWNKYYQIDGFLLGYEVEQYGKRMKLRAREITFQPIAPDRFVAPEGYTALNALDMDKQIKKVVEEFMVSK
jgi:hypothetical protein